MRVRVGHSALAASLAAGALLLTATGRPGKGNFRADAPAPARVAAVR